MPAIAIAELLLHVVRGDEASECRAALQFVLDDRLDILPEAQLCLLNAFGLPRGALEHGHRDWRKLVRMAVSPERAPSLKGCWDALRGRGRVHATYDGMVHTKADRTFVSDFVSLREELDGKTRKVLDEISSNRADRRLVTAIAYVKCFIEDGLVRAWLLNQLAGGAGVVEVDARLRAGGVGANPYAVYSAFTGRLYRCGLEVLVRVMEGRMALAHQIGSGPAWDTNDFDDMLILASVADGAAVLVTNDVKWVDAASFSGISDRVMRPGAFSGASIPVLPRIRPSPHLKLEAEELRRLAADPRVLGLLPECAAVGSVL